MDKEKLKEQARVVMTKARAAMSEIKDNFKADEGATGVRKIQSRFVNLWKSGMPGRVALIVSPVVVLLLLVLVFGGGDSVGCGKKDYAKAVACTNVATKAESAPKSASQEIAVGKRPFAESPVPSDKPVAPSPVQVENPAVAADDTGIFREERERVSAQNRIKEIFAIKKIFALAEKSAEEDNNINFCGFFTGMSRHDAADLAAYYKLKEGEYTASARPGKAVSRLWFSPKGVRRITGGGNTIEELAQAVANRVGDLKGSYGGGVGAQDN